MSHLLALKNAISPTPRHARNVQELGAVDHVIICIRISAQFKPVEICLTYLHAWRRKLL